MNKKTVLSTLPLLVGVLAILSASSFLVFTWRGPKIELNPYQALGTVAAEETIKLMGDNQRSLPRFSMANLEYGLNRDSAVRNQGRLVPRGMSRGNSRERRARRAG